MKYPKLQTVFKRESEKPFRIIEGKFALPEFEYLQNNQWVWTEKVDGTNIRIYWDCETVRVAGRTDNAQIPAFLYDRLQLILPPSKFVEHYPETPMVLYGEGYGAKIQKGGGNYRSDGVDFVLFDIRIDEWWLERKGVDQIADKLQLERVPIVGTGTLHEAIEMVKSGFDSEWGDFKAEGLVLRTTPILLCRNGERVMTKIKHKDFKEQPE